MKVRPGIIIEKDLLDRLDSLLPILNKNRSGAISEAVEMYLSNYSGAPADLSEALNMSYGAGKVKIKKENNDV